MSRQRERSRQRRPIELEVEHELSAFVGKAGVVEVERHAHDWKEDDLLVQVRLHRKIEEKTLSLFRAEIFSLMKSLLVVGQPCGSDWLVAIEAEGRPLSTVSCGEK